MQIFSIILVYTIAWWLVFFMILPIGHQNQSEGEEGRVLGTPDSAPENPMMGKKVLWTSIIAAVLTVIYVIIMEFDLVSIRPPVQ